jgi:hypothetical protein
MSAYRSITDFSRKHGMQHGIQHGMQHGMQHGTAVPTTRRSDTVKEPRRQGERDVRELLDLVDVRNSWQHRNALATLVGIDVTLGISDTALRRVVRKVGVEAIEREIEDVRYGAYAPRSQRPRPPAIVRRGRRPG